MAGKTVRQSVMQMQEAPDNDQEAVGQVHKQEEGGKDPARRELDRAKPHDDETPDGNGRTRVCKPAFHTPDVRFGLWRAKPVEIAAAFQE
jgi:hypothetical protein